MTNKRYTDVEQIKAEAYKEFADIMMSAAISAENI